MKKGTARVYTGFAVAFIGSGAFLLGMANISLPVTMVGILLAVGGTLLHYPRPNDEIQ